MDFYQSYINMLAEDIRMDTRGSGIIILDRSVYGPLDMKVELEHEKQSKFEAMLRNSGVKFEKRFCHTYVLTDYPEDVKLQKV